MLVYRSVYPKNQPGWTFVGAKKEVGLQKALFGWKKNLDSFKEAPKWLLEYTLVRLILRANVGITPLSGWWFQPI